MCGGGENLTLDSRDYFLEITHFLMIYSLPFTELGQPRSLYHENVICAPGGALVRHSIAARV